MSDEDHLLHEYGIFRASVLIITSEIGFRRQWMHACAFLTHFVLVFGDEMSTGRG